MIKHYDGVIGSFDYDDEMWKISYDFGDSHDILCYNQGYSGPIDIPKGLKTLNGAFSCREVAEGCYIRHADLSEVVSTRLMFSQAKLPAGFHLGIEFNTVNVENMEKMFECTELPEGFSLGPQFNTKNVKNMSGMFRYCKMPRTFTLGRRFSTANVTTMYEMFFHCRMSDNFKLPKKFDTANVKDMQAMFAFSEVPKSFRLNDNFVRTEGTIIQSMFERTKLPEGFRLPEGFSTLSKPGCVDANVFSQCFVGEELMSGLVPDVIAHLKGEDSTNFF